MSHHELDILVGFILMHLIFCTKKDPNQLLSQDDCPQKQHRKTASLVPCTDTSAQQGRRILHAKNNSSGNLGGNLKSDRSLLRGTLERKSKKVAPSLLTSERGPFFAGSQSVGLGLLRPGSPLGAFTYGFSDFSSTILNVGYEFDFGYPPCRTTH